MMALPVLVYILMGLWEINTAAAKVELPEADVICFSTALGGMLLLQGSSPQTLCFITLHSLNIY